MISLITVFLLHSLINTISIVKISYESIWI